MPDADQNQLDRPANLTRAGVTGKVPQRAIRPRRAGKKVKMASHQKRHVGQLQKHGQISAKAAAQTGLRK